MRRSDPCSSSSCEKQSLWLIAAVVLTLATLTACAGGDQQQVDAELDRQPEASPVAEAAVTEPEVAEPAAEGDPEAAAEDAAAVAEAPAEEPQQETEVAEEAVDEAAEAAESEDDTGSVAETDDQPADDPPAEPETEDTTDTAALWGTSWRLTDLGGRPAMGQVQATLDFPDEGGRAVGNASCNRFFGQVQVSEDAISFIDVGTMRMACRPAVLDQETRFLTALESAERFEVEGDQLRIYAGDREQPMTFSRVIEENS